MQGRWEQQQNRHLPSSWARRRLAPAALCSHHRGGRAEASVPLSTSCLVAEPQPGCLRNGAVGGVEGTSAHCHQDRGRRIVPGTSVDQLCPRPRFEGWEAPVLPTPMLPRLGRCWGAWHSCPTTGALGEPSTSGPGSVHLCVAWPGFLGEGRLSRKRRPRPCLLRTESGGHLGQPPTGASPGAVWAGAGGPLRAQEAGPGRDVPSLVQVPTASVSIDPVPSSP